MVCSQGYRRTIVPFAFDQSDNAEHARKVGTSRTVYRDKYLAPRVTDELHELLKQPSYAPCNGSQPAAETGEWAGAAADLIEQVLNGTRNRTEEAAYATGD